ncbi:hypothetical protein [Tabrizicola sp.]
MLVMSKDSSLSTQLIELDLLPPRDCSAPAFVALRKRLMSEFGLH